MKGIALNELAYLIIAVILVAILLVLFFVFQFPFMVFPIVLFDHLSTLLRGFVIDGIWTAFKVLLAFFIFVIWISMANPSCWGPQVVGCAAKNAIMTAIVVSVMTWMAFTATSAVPLVYIPIKLNVNNVTLNKNLADWIVDAGYMANSGNNDPFRGTSTNPKISFKIKVNKGTLNLKDALYRLDAPTYSVYDKIKGRVWDDDNFIKNKWRHSITFGVDIKINKTNGKWTLWVENSTNSHLCGSWVLSVDSDTGNIKPQENTYKCGNGKKHKIFVGPSSTNIARLHVTIGKYILKYTKLKAVIVKIQDSNGHWNSYKVVYTNVNWGWTCVQEYICIYNPHTHKVFNLGKGLNRYIKSGKIVYIYYLDACDFCNYYASECGGDLDGTEGVYVCIPK